MANNSEVYNSYPQRSSENVDTADQSRQSAEANPQITLEKLLNDIDFMSTKCDILEDDRDMLEANLNDALEEIKSLRTVAEENKLLKEEIQKLLATVAESKQRETELQTTISAFERASKYIDDL